MENEPTVDIAEDAEDKLEDYLGWDVTLDSLLELWEKLGGIYSADQLGIACRIVEDYGIEPIRKILLEEFFPQLIPQLVSEDPQEREDAKERMDKMGFDLAARSL